MRRSNNGLLPHKESSIVLSTADKIIFGIGCAVYGAAVVLEEKFHKRTAVSSSLAIMIVGIFLVSREIQNLRKKTAVLTKDKAKLAVWLIIGIVLSIAGIISLVFDIKKLI